MSLNSSMSMRVGRRMYDHVHVSGCVCHARSCEFVCTFAKASLYAFIFLLQNSLKHSLSPPPPPTTNLMPMHLSWAPLCLICCWSWSLQIREMGRNTMLVLLLYSHWAITLPPHLTSAQKASGCVPATCFHQGNKLQGSSLGWMYVVFTSAWISVCTSVNVHGFGRHVAECLCF